jgi:Domain of unknown function (DUF5069)
MNGSPPSGVTRRIVLSIERFIQRQRLDSIGHALPFVAGQEKSVVDVKFTRVTSLSLTERPPRPPREAAGGITFLPRTIDKARASLPGGNLGDYRLRGISGRLLDHLGIPEDRFVAAVGAAVDDDAVVEWLKSETTQAKIDAWNAFVKEYVPLGGDRAKIQEAFPWLQPDAQQSLLALDLLPEDDRRAFA